MKKALTLIAVVLTLSASAQQTSLRVGPAVAYQNKEAAFGGELVFNVKTLSGLTAGAGVTPLDFKGVGLMTPAFVTLGYDVAKFHIHADAGKTLYSKTQTVNGTKVNAEGGLYLAGGLKYSFMNHFYANLQYVRYGTKGSVSGIKVTGTTNGALLSIGYQLGE